MYDTGWDAGLDEQQLAAVLHGDDPLVILAGAGTGKTRTLTSRVASPARERYAARSASCC